MSENLLIELMAGTKQQQQVIAEQQKSLEAFKQAAEKSILESISAIPQNVDISVHAAIMSLSDKVYDTVTKNTSENINNQLQKLDKYNYDLSEKICKAGKINNLIENTIIAIKPTMMKQLIMLLIISLLLTCIPVSTAIFFSNKLVETRKQIINEQLTLELLQNKTWQLELLTQNNEKWIILPDGAKFVGQATDSRGRTALQMSDQRNR